ncbi:MAG: amidohydrolase family protein [Patescibacteria group bacterium]|nr:amidohydrolase family protein [Patescibacteria group bacterium]
MIIDIHTHNGVNWKKAYEGRFPSSSNIEMHKQILKDIRIDIAISFPFGHALYFDFTNKDRLQPSGFDNFPYHKENIDHLKQCLLFGEGRIIPFVNICPGEKEDQQIELIQSHAHEIYGIKFHTTLTQKTSKDLENSGFLQLAQEHDWGILLHSDNTEYGDPCAIYDLAERNPENRFLVAHMGADCNAEFFTKLRNKRLPNLFIDCSPWFGIVAYNNHFKSDKSLPEDWNSDPYKLFEKFADEFSDILCFGTDSPFTTEHLPSENLTVQSTYQENIDLLNHIQDPEKRDAVAYKNSLRFLGKKGETLI